MRTIVARLCLVGALVITLVASAPTSPTAVAADESVDRREAIRFREAAGFRADADTIDASLSGTGQFSNTEFGVPLSDDEAREMRRRVDLQNALAPAWAYEEGTSESGGSYIDQANGGIPVFLFTADLDGHRGALARLVPPGTEFRVELVEHTTAQLTATRDELWAARGDLASLGIRVMLAGLDPSTNSVVVGVERLSANAAVVIGERFPAVVTLRDEAQAQLDLHACTSRVHCWPHKGGIEMNIFWNGATRHCTSGFMVKRTNLTPNRLYILTAGHCIELTGGVSVNRVWDHVGAELGYSAGETWATNAIGDAGVIFVLGNPTVDREFLAREGPIEIRALASVATLVETKKGTYICRMGRTTGRQCGFIFLVDVTRDVEGRDILHQYEVDFDSDMGDSGAPMFEGTKGYGIATHSVAGYVPANHAWFSPLYWERQALMGVNIDIEYCLTNTCP